MDWIIFFELFVIITTGLVYWFMKKNGYKNVTRKFIILGVAVLLFEIMSEPMWMNLKLHDWAYVYSDVSWIITLGWISIFMVSFMLVDNYFGHLAEKKKFWLYLFFIEAITVPIETFLVESGIRAYAPILTETMTGKLIPLTSVPVEAIYAIPLFTALIIAFYKYINYIFDEKKTRN